jgi:hypothetical protein
MNDLSAWKDVEDAEPLWSRVLRAGLAVLIINLLWNDPIAPAAGEGLVPLVAFNLVPSVVAIAAILGGMRLAVALRSLVPGR